MKRLQANRLFAMQTIEHLFGIAVRRHREGKRFSQEEFADIAKIHRTYVSSIELGKVRVSIAVAQQLATALGVPLSKIWREIEAELAK